ncbi:MAG: hypothetical protein QMD43_01265 [Thermodesulfovibrio sp.]|uniref:DUF6800 family protein n=1 Tax=Thermodesulfovibrio sp. 1176 TaxID=3043424 RepID=UPI002482CE8A|nr:DUF6800 family protein [Thermodesulfovibrio sp. 1176]MDI1471751.1 hypothetical protein [Thermodesulfovibrio sp. 1176]MDI6713642.1 hypothetical protein [Thermodesulfovibrio sp.]
MSRRLVERDLKKRRHRREKLSKLREKFKLAKTEEEKKRILNKVSKIAPSLKIEDFLASVK